MAAEEAWAAVAEGEAAALYAYGVLTAQLTSAQRPQAESAGVAHARARDRARAALDELGARAELPVAFDIPFPLVNSQSAQRLAALLELRLVEVYSTFASEVEGKDRTYFALTAQECARRSVSWGQRPLAFPGGAGQSTPAPAPSAGASRTAPPEPSSLPATPQPGGTGDGARVE